MGYYSEVRCLIYGPKEKLDLFLTTQALLENSTVFRDFKSSLERYTIKDRVLDSNGLFVEVTYHVLDLYGKSWKWYDDYPDVEAWRKFMTAAEEEGELEFEFIRIGEGEGDIERISTENNAGFLYVTTPTIGSDFDKGEIIPLPF